MGIKIARETENPPKMMPNQIPLAPNFKAKIGSKGAIIPKPSMDTNIARKIILKALRLIMRVIIT
jgi:hypothetical protein